VQAATPVLLLCLALTSCGRIDEAAPWGAGRVTTQELVLAETGWGQAAHAVVSGDAWLEVRTRGRGELTLALTLQALRAGAQPEPPWEQTFATPPGVERFHLEVQASGPRALALLLQTSGDTSILDVTLIQPEVDRSVTPTRLTGALAGKDVMVFLFDSLDAAHMSSWGYARDTSPHHDKLVQGGVQFRQAYSQTSWTLSSVASLFTSLEQERHAVRHLDQRLPESFTTLAMLYKAAGYRTVALVQNGVIWPQTGLDQGFEEYSIYEASVKGTRQIERRLREVTLAEEAQADARPLFLYVHWIPPHQPYQPPGSFMLRYISEESDSKVDGSIDWCVELNKRRPARTDPDVVRLEALYDAHIRFADDVAGKFLSEWDAAGKLEETLLISLSDHGEAFFQHGVQGHNAHVYEEMVHVPLVFHGPRLGIPSGRSVADPVSLLDVMPTLVELSALGEPEQPMRGRSLVPLLEGHTARQEPLFITSRYRSQDSRVHGALRLGDLKLVSTPLGKFLFDLENDPAESEDITARNPLASAAFASSFEAWYRAALAEAPEVERVELDESRRRVIEALGYGGEEDE